MQRFLTRGFKGTPRDAVTFSDEVNTLAAPVKAPAKALQIAAAIEKGVKTFVDTAPALMKTLGAVAKVYPFIF